MWIFWSVKIFAVAVKMLQSFLRMTLTWVALEVPQRTGLILSLLCDWPPESVHTRWGSGSPPVPCRRVQSNLLYWILDRFERALALPFASSTQSRAGSTLESVGRCVNHVLGGFHFGLLRFIVHLAPRLALALRLIFKVIPKSYSDCLNLTFIATPGSKANAGPSQ